ncbi:Transglutaminase domain protein [Sterolibacterium denitrificans]|uniref:Transglutaminase domain protein n=2 Tax=Sterolibacterium denitrificans TaxID=157592 RepID=A0A7Z7MWJ1_9PROT|nr:DUF3488 and transglutaminase-like domain-containing protein [Sterolibacterium denitrificans]KYC29335.1 hypothetical protein ACY05_02055 [Sterolibacterium denitrificans]SMB30827.1 Transglutaminase domain protein [Sterolibacterium denitrificans]
MARTEAAGKTARRPTQPLQTGQLRWLLAMAACCELPLLPHLPEWLAALCVLLLIWFAVLHWRRISPAAMTTSGRGPKLPGPWLLTPLALIGTAAIGIHYHTLFGRSVGVALLALLCSLKLLEARTTRDGFVLVLLGCFMLLGQFFHSQGMTDAVLMLAGVLVVTATLAMLNYPRHETLPVLRLAGRLLLQAMPLMLALFVLFPRIQGPLWGLPADAFAGTMGLSDSMSPGNIAQLSQSGAVAFRARFGGEFDGRAPAQSSLYWRGPVLNNFDGRTWTVRQQPALTELPYAPTGKPVEYSLTLEPHDKQWLFALDLPTMLPSDTSMSGDFQLLARRPVRGRMRYELRSALPIGPIAPRAPTTTAEDNRQDAALKAALQLPAAYNPRTRALAASWRKELRGDARAIAQRMLDYLHDEDFYYTLRPPLLGANSVDELLFETRRGFCEHYAAAFVFMMRAAGIPARVVTGYQGGELNPVDGTLIVRQSDAHAWAEVWFAGATGTVGTAGTMETAGPGWQRVDPTAAIAPMRVERSLADALPAGEREILPLITRLPFPWLRDVRLRLDALSNTWNQWVIGYNQQRQRNLLDKLGVDAGDWRQMSLLFSVLSGVLMLGLLAWALHVRQTADPVVAAWQRLSKKLAPLNLARHPWEGPEAYMRRIHARLRAEEKTAAPADRQRAEAVAAIADLYIRLRYAADAAPPAQRKAWLRELEQRIARFK